MNGRISSYAPQAGWRVVLGPPGCGKTTRLMELIKSELQRGARIEDMAVVSFTRAACEVATERALTVPGLGARELPWFRTIHSAAYRLLRLRPGQVMGPERWAEFAKTAGYQLTGFDDFGEDGRPGMVELPRRTNDDKLRFVHQWGGNRQLDLKRTLAQCRVVVNAIACRRFTERLGRFKDENGLLDFNDMLVRVLAQGLRPPVTVAFIDEAQDLSPLQIAVVESWFTPCERVYVAGDEDQSIFTFQGADPEWLISLAERCPPEVLSHSYRLPATIHAVADRIIRRNTRRIAKEYEPNGKQGVAEALPLRRVLDLLDGGRETFVLARNRMFLVPIARALFDRRVPYVVEGKGGVSPLRSRATMAAVNAANLLHLGKSITADQLVDLLACIPSRGAGLLPHGIKAKAKKMEGPITEQELIAMGLGTLLTTIRTKGPTSVLSKVRPADIDYFQALLARFGEIPEPRIRLMTIHASKGREADLVVIVPDMTAAAFAEYRDARRGGHESENRIAYVGVTRAREHLVILQPTTRRFFDYAISKIGRHSL